MIDADTGMLGAAASFPGTGTIEWCSHHPECGSPIEGRIVPHWTELTASILHTASRFPMLPYIGWDIVHMDDGIKVLEGNSNSDVNLLQIHGPLLRDSQVRRFYRHHRIV